MRSLSLFMTELGAPDNTQVLLPNGQVWGAAIINHSAYPGTGELNISFPIRAGAAVQAIGDEILRDLHDDPRVDGQTKPAVHLSKVMDVSDPAAPIVELTVSARVKPSDTDAVKQKLLDRAATLVGSGANERLAAQASG
jgi:small conductance mechanosensitive channel